MKHLEQLPRTINQRRPRSVQQLIPHNKHVPLPYRGHILPCRYFIGLLGLGVVSRRRPCQHHHLRTRLRHFFITDLFSSLHHHLSATNLHQLRHPRRRTDPRIRPSFAVNAHPPPVFPRAARNLRELPPHLADQGLCRACTPRDSAQQANVRVHVVQRPRTFACWAESRGVQARQ